MSKNKEKKKKDGLHWWSLVFISLALSYIHFVPFSSLPFLLLLKNFKNKLLTYLQNPLSLQLKYVMTEFVGNLSLGKSRDQNSSKEIIGLLVKKISKGFISSTVKFEGFTFGSGFVSNALHSFIQKRTPDVWMGLLSSQIRIEAICGFIQLTKVNGRKPKGAIQPSETYRTFKICPLGMLILMQFSVCAKPKWKKSNPVARSCRAAQDINFKMLLRKIETVKVNRSELEFVFSTAALTVLCSALIAGRVLEAHQCFGFF